MGPVYCTQGIRRSPLPECFVPIGCVTADSESTMAKHSDQAGPVTAIRLIRVTPSGTVNSAQCVKASGSRDCGLDGEDHPAFPMFPLIPPSRGVASAAV